MYAIQHANEMSESAVMNMIADAARANEARATREIDGHTVRFARIENSADYSATVTTAAGAVVARACVDQWDI